MTEIRANGLDIDLSWAEEQLAGRPPLCELLWNAAVRDCDAPAVCRVVLQHPGGNARSYAACARHRDDVVNDAAAHHGRASRCPRCHTSLFLLRVEPL